MINSIPVQMIGHLRAVDDLGQVHIDEYNAIHPQNMARIFSRALAHEANSYIHRMAFGNGGTTINAALETTFNPPNDGQSPDANTWDSRLYHETYSEIVDETDSAVGTDPGSADINTGQRPGGGAVPSGDAAANSVVSNDLGLISSVVIQCTLNSGEPLTQNSSDGEFTTQADFAFDEIGLYTSGAQALPTAGYQYINVGGKVSTSDTTLVAGTTYSFNLVVDGGTMQTISFTCPITGGSGPSNEILYGDLCQALNTGDPTWSIAPAAPVASVSITDVTGGTYPSITGAQTYGFLKFESPNAGTSSSVNLAGASTSAWLNSLNAPVGATLEPAVAGSAAGVQNDPVNPTNERERLLTHVIFSPVIKAANRTLVITYTLTISVARTPH